jgi:hypothetical protein
MLHWRWLCAARERASDLRVCLERGCAESQGSGNENENKNEKTWCAPTAQHIARRTHFAAAGMAHTRPVLVACLAAALLLACAAAATAAQAPSPAPVLAAAPQQAVELASAAAAAGDYRDVCVVGAGPAGMAAALALARRNKSVALLERSTSVGGQCDAEYIDPASGFRLHMGAVIFNPVADVRLMALAKELGIGAEARPTMRCICAAWLLIASCLHARSCCPCRSSA